MTQLKYSKVFRGGATAQSLSFETRRCSAKANIESKTLDINFELASKGGGITRVLLRINKKDFLPIMQDIAENIPDVAGSFLECAVIANNKNSEILQEAQKAQYEVADIKERVADLDMVSEFISQKYYEAPLGEDDLEMNVRNKFEEFVRHIKNL